MRKLADFFKKIFSEEVNSVGLLFSSLPACILLHDRSYTVSLFGLWIMLDVFMNLQTPHTSTPVPTDF